MSGHFERTRTRTAVPHSLQPAPAVTRARPLPRSAVPWVTPSLPPKARLLSAIGRLQLVRLVGFGSDHAVAAFARSAPVLPTVSATYSSFEIFTSPFASFEKDKKPDFPCPSWRQVGVTSIPLPFSSFCDNRGAIRCPAARARPFVREYRTVLAFRRWCGSPGRLAAPWTRARAWTK